MPLALRPEFAEEPDAMFILWKDHTAVREAEQINALIDQRNLDYLLYEGGTYSSEWVWSKVLHIINTNVAIKDVVYAWVEHCDWMTGLVTGNTIREQIFRSRCAAGHKAMWHASWGLPSGEVLEELNPGLEGNAPPSLHRNPHQRHQGRGTDTRVGRQAWTSPGIAVAVGALDAHMGAVGASVAPGILTRIMGTSTCDIMVAGKERGRRTLYQGNLRPGGRFGASGIHRFRSRQSAFGDI